MSRSGMLKLSFPYLLFLLMGLGVYWSNVRASHADAHYRLGRDTAAGDDTPQSTKTKRWIDPVCQMDVNPAWGFTHEHEGEVYYFCARRCVEEFAAAPESFLTARCLVCKQALEADNRFPATYLDNTYYLCSAAHRDEFKADPAGFFMHRMWGIPDWLYYISIGLVLVVSFLMFEGSTLLRRSTRQSQTATEMASRSHTTTTPHDRAKHGSLSTRVPIAAVATGPPAAAGVLSLPILGGAGQPISARTAHPDSALHRSSDRIDLMQLWVVRTLLRSRPFRFAVQLFVVALFLLIIAAGLFGNQNPGLNIAPILTWTIWWAGLVVLIMFAGKAWCYMCPWDAVAGWMERFALWWKTEEGAGLSLKWPRIIRNITIATIMFVGLTWVELGFGVTMSPSATAYIAIAMLLMAIVSAFLFDRKSFCRYGCLVGRVSGLYALFSAVEIRHRDANTCLRCRTHDCYKGSEKAYGCPTFENPGTMSTNTYCIQCAECLQACPHDNLAVNLRPWGEDLKSASRPRRDEAYLALLMLSLTGFHGLSMTPAWQTIQQGLASAAGLGPVGAFSLGMLILTAAPVAVYALLVWVSYAISAHAARDASSNDTDIRLSYFDYFVRYAYCVLPIALFYHLAHNLEHLLIEGQKIVTRMSDPFGWGWNLFQTADRVIPPLVSLDVLWALQVVLVAVGHVYSLWAANKISRRMFVDKKSATLGQWPMLAGMILFSVLSLWLLKQPMEMRTSAM